jgi:hypothetical protein
VIPSAIIGKERGFIAQYLIVLLLSLLAFFMPEIPQANLGIPINQLLSGAGILQNPLVAVVYLSVPYLFMIGI